MAAREGTMNATTLQERRDNAGGTVPPMDAGEPIEGPTKGRRRRIIIPVVIVVVLLGLIFGLRYLAFASRHVTTDDAQISGNITTISPRVKGQVTAVYVSDDQSVHRGAKLVTLDDRDYKVAVLQAQAAYDQAVSGQQAAKTAVPQQSAMTAAQTAQAQAGIDQTSSAVTNAQQRVASANSELSAARNRVSQAQAQWTAAKAAAVKAAQDLNRARTLTAAGAIPQSQLDQARAAYDSAVANQNAAAQGISVAQSAVSQAQNGITSAQAGVVQAQAQVQGSRAQLAQAQTGEQSTQIKSAQASVSGAQVKAAAAALANAKLQESYTVIQAPITGVVSKKSVNVGDTISAGQPLMAIADQQNIWITANLKETQISNVRVGQPVDIKVDAFRKRVFAGKVESLSAATGATRSGCSPATTR